MYDPTTGFMCFGEALSYLKRQLPTARAAWPKGIYVTRTHPNATLTFMTPVDPLGYPWAPSSDDVLAEDWVPIFPADTQQGK